VSVPGNGNGGGPGDDEYFPTYEEIASELLEALEAAGLVVHDVRHDLEPSTGERRFECTARLPGGDPPPRYYATLHFHWDALLTYVGAYGGGSECDLYHEDDTPCPHQSHRPQPFVEIETHYTLGNSGYQLADLGEVPAWVTTVRELLSETFGEEEQPAVRIGLSMSGTSIHVESFYAEHAWFLDADEAPDLAPLCRQVAAVLRLTPTLADRLPL